MDWNAAASVAEVIGAIAVIISLVYLATEVRSNTNALKASAGFDASLHMSELNEVLFQSILGDAVYQQGGELRLAKVIAKTYDPKASPDDLSPSDHLLLAFTHRAVFQKIEGEYYLYQHGFLETAQWEARRSWACGLIELPIPKAWWKSEIDQGIFRPEFVAAITAAGKARLEIPGGRG
ncbi:MAG: hypothetical protein KJN69_11010 [Gammaproteobacteria bacterium]|nr:hypothetical protein [Gammaproteobacteria bacterium]